MIDDGAAKQAPAGAEPDTPVAELDAAVESDLLVEDELLVEDISIDGMCGVY